MTIFHLFLLFQLIQTNFTDKSKPHLEENPNALSYKCSYDYQCSTGCCNSGVCDSECCISSGQCITHCCVNRICIPLYNCKDSCGFNFDCDSGCCVNYKCVTWNNNCCNKDSECDTGYCGSGYCTIRVISCHENDDCESECCSNSKCTDKSNCPRKWIYILISIIGALIMLSLFSKFLCLMCANA